MAADSRLTLTSTPAAAPLASPSKVSSGAPSPACPLAPAASGPGTADRGAGQTNSSGSRDSQGAQSSQSAGDRSAAPGSGTKAASNGSKASGKDAAAASGNSRGAAGNGRRSARTSGSSTSGSAQGTPQAAARGTAAGTDFSAALAQSLAATPADGTAAPTAAAGQSPGKSDTSDSSGPTRHTAADPVSSALTLLQQALAGALAGAQATAAAAATTPAPAGSSSSSLSDGSTGAGAAVAGTSDKNSAATLDALLTQNLSADAKSGGANTPSAADPSSVATPAATATSAAAALTAAAQLSPVHGGSQQGTTPTQMALASPVGTSAWTDELGTKVTWMAHQGIESASLQLSPEHLGPLQVNISVHDGQASVWFGAAQPDTRTALQQSLPQLRQLFASQGLNLADAGVSREPPRGQSRQSSGRAAAPVSAVAAASLESAGTRAAAIGGLGLLDTYA